MALPEDGPLEEIEVFFSQRHLQVVTHDEPPPEPTPEDWRSMSALERKARRRVQDRFWADLKRIETGRLIRWYGGGESPAAAIRSARSRWRVEQGDGL